MSEPTAYGGLAHRRASQLAARISSAKLATSEANVIQNLIDLYRALGGGWTAPADLQPLPPVTLPGAPEEIAPSPQEETLGTAEGEIEFFIQNAAIVLLAPFFVRYLEAIQIVKDGKFIHKTAQTRAVLMLHYLGTGVTRPEESVLVLPKILCGIPPSEVLSQKGIRPNKTQKELTNSLLRAAVQHWGTIGDTSPETLRESFLERSGTLLLSDEKWLLQVEKRSYDMLLRSLPWGITPINLPWMSTMLNVEWNY